MSRIVAVTGATGFIGGALLKALLAQGWEVRALTRGARTSAPAKNPRLHWVTGDLDDQDSLERLVHDAHAVVHCAGAVRGITQAQFDHVNETGVRRIANAILAQAHPPRLVALSSLAARKPSLSPYAASKRKGEKVLLELGDKVDWLAFRPPAVYGPGDRELLPLFQWMARGLAILPGPGEARFSLIYVDDLVQAILQGLEIAPGHSGIYELDDGRSGGYSWDDVVAIFSRLRGKRVVKCAIPAWLLRGLGEANLLMARMGGYAPMLTPGKVRELRYLDWVCHHTGSWRDISGWSPQVSLPEGLKNTLHSL